MTSILYLSPYFWPEEIGSAPYCTDLALWLRDRGLFVRVVAFRPHYPNADQFTAWADGSRDEDSLEGIPIDRVPVTDRGRGGFGDRIKNDLAFLQYVSGRAFRGEFRGTNVVVAYVPSILTLYGAFVVRLLTGARIVACVHDIESGLAKSLGLATNRVLLFFMTLVERIGLNRADHVVVLTAGMRNEIRDIGCRRPISVLSIWASVPPIAQPLPEGAITMMYSGNFGRKQNLEQLLPLFKRLSVEGSPIRILLRGNGHERDLFRKKVDEAQIANVTFLPLTPASEFMASLQAVNIHIVPQAMNVANYSLPSKLFSIMAAGRPFICIAASGSPLDELAGQSAAGICVRSGDDESLHHAVVDLAQDSDRQRRMGEAGRRFVEKYMSKPSILQAYEKLICP